MNWQQLPSRQAPSVNVHLLVHVAVGGARAGQLGPAVMSGRVEDPVAPDRFDALVEGEPRYTSHHLPVYRK